MTSLRPYHDELSRLLVESVEDYAIFVLDPDGFIRSWNSGAERIKGYSASEAIGMHVSKFYRPGDRSWEDAMRSARDVGPVQLDGWRVRKDGTEFWASVVITALRDDEGNLIGFAKVTRDLTDRTYRAFVEASHAILWTADTTGRPNADSASWRAFTGQSEAEWRGGHGWDALHPEDRASVEAAWSRARSDGTTFEAEYRLRRYDGEYAWMSARAVPLYASDGSIREWFGVAIDVSDRKKAELEVQRARSSFETTLRSIGDGVVATDARGVVTFVNAVAEQLTGWSSADAIGRPLTEIFPIINEYTRAAVENPVERVLREGIIVGLANHTLLLRRDHSEVPIDDSAAPIRGPGGQLDGVVLVFRDVSREKLLMARREFLLRASMELEAASDYRDALRKIARLAVPRLADWCAVDVVDPHRPTPIRIAVAHTDPAKVAHARELERSHPPDPNATTGVANVLRTGRSELYTEISREMLEASAVDEEHRRILTELDLGSAMVVPLKARSEVFGAVTFIFTGKRRYTEDDLEFAEDFALRAAMVVERRKLEEEARRASRAKDEFLAMLGHELRNPLAPIRTALDLMALAGDRTMERERNVIDRQVQHLTSLVDDLLDVSRITRAKITLLRSPVEIRSVIDRALEMASPLLESRQHHVEVRVPDTEHVVFADPARLAQVFANLLTNAAKFTDRGGRISIDSVRDGEEIVVRVRDSGIGIDPEVLPTIFDLFVQEPQSSARSHGGLGLGLSIARSLVTMHGGTISAESRGRGRGSTFSVRLPAHAPAAAEVTRPSRPPEPAPSHTARVLLVDDNEDAAILSEMALEKMGFDVRIAFDGPTALAIAETFVPEVAVLDIGLPVMDGYELAKRLRERFSDLPLIALTGYGQEEHQRKARAAGFDVHLTKPMDARRLHAAIDEVIASQSPA